MVEIKTVELFLGDFLEHILDNALDAALQLQWNGFWSSTHALQHHDQVHFK
jgi:hypothetical protein